MKILKNIGILVKPKSTLFNPKRIVYEIGQTTMYADKGKGSVYLGKNGTIYAYRLKNLGVCTLGNEFPQPQRIFIQNSKISGNIAVRNKDTVTLRNCELPSPKPQAPKYNAIVDIVYKNRS